MASCGGLQGMLAGFTTSTDHPSRGPLKGLWASCWVDIKHGKNWYKHKDFKVRGTYD